MHRPLGEVVFLVSGGGRGVTAQCLIALAKAHGGKFILLGRSALDPTHRFADYESDADLKGQIVARLRDHGQTANPANIEKLFREAKNSAEVKATLREIRQAGADVDYIGVDIADRDALRAALGASRTNVITGIIHGAGVISDKLIENKTAADFDNVYSTKISGLRSMLDCVDPGTLAYLTLFSSMAGFYGNRGQADYAVANEILNKFAHAFKREHPACHTTVFDWGPWDGGMVTPHLKQHFERNHIQVMPVAAGARAFVEVLAGDNTDVQLLINADPVQLSAAPVAVGAPPRLARRLSLAGNPFLQDHVIGGYAVLPTACAGLWMANSCLQLYPGYGFSALSDLRVLKGVVFDGDQAQDYRLDIADTAVSAASIIQTATIWSETSAKKRRYHYRAGVELSPVPAAAAHYHQADLAADDRLEGLRPYQDGALFHGPVFQGIRRILNVSPSKITVECQYRAPPRQVMGQFPPVSFDPVLLDLLFQCLGLWVHQRLTGVALPLRCDRFEFHAPPPEESKFYISADIAAFSSHKVSAVITMHDGEGVVFSRASGVELTINPDFGRHAAAPMTILAAG